MAQGTTTNKLQLKVGLTFSKTEAIAAVRGELTNMQKEISGRNIDLSKSLNLKTANTEIKKTTKNMSDMGRLLDSLKTKFKQQAKNFLVFSVMSSAALFATTQIRRMVEVITELDTAFTNLAIVTGANAQELEAVDKQVSALTLSLGRMKEEVVNAVTEFARAGYTIADSMILAENAIMGANAGGVDLATITTTLIAGLKSFKMEAEDSAKILDTLFTVANITAIDMEGISAAFLRSANTLVFAGASLEESAALIAAANETIQDPAKVGTALKTIASRLRGVGEEGEAIPTLANDFKRIGIEIQNADGSFRDIYSIFSEFAGVYKNLDDLTQQSLIEKIAGKRQANILVGLVENFNLAEKSLSAAYNSTGAVAEANEKVVESIVGKVNLFKTAVQELYQVLLESDSVKAFVDFATEVVKVLTTLAKILPELSVAIGTIIGINGIAGITAAMGSLGAIGAGTLLTFGAFVPVIGGVALALAGLSAVMNKYGEDTETSAEKTEKFAKQQENLRKKIEEGSLAQRKAMAETLKDIQKQLKELKPVETGGFAGTVSEAVEASKSVQEYQAKVESLNAQLVSLGFTQEQATEFINQTTLAVEGLTDADIALADTLGLINSLLLDSSDNQQLLADTIFEATTQGYLSDDLLNKMIETYPEFVTVTGLAKDAVIQFANQQLAANEETINSNIATLKADLTIAQNRMSAYKAEADALMALAQARQIGGYGIGYAIAEQTSGLAEEELNISNIKNTIALLENELLQFSDIEVGLGNRIKDFNEESKKSIDILSSEEIAVRDLNQQIAIQEKLLARAGTDEEKIAINEKLIQLNKDLKLALEAQKTALINTNKSTKQGTEEYDKYISELYSLSLQIEDVTNEMYNLQNSIDDIREAALEASKDLAEEGLQDATEALNNEIDKQVKLLEDAKDASDKYYDGLIDSKQAEIDAYKLQNELIDEQIKLQEALDRIQELRERKANILANKNVRLVQNADVGFELVADPRELRQVNEEIADAEKDLATTRTEIARNAEIRRLENEKSALEETQRIEQESYDTRIAAYETFADTINGIDKLRYETGLSALDEYIRTYNAKLSTLGVITNAINGTTGTGSGNMNFDAIYNTPSATKVGATLTTPTATNVSTAMNNTTTNKSNQTNIGTVHVTSPATSVDALVNDINSKKKVYQPKVNLY